MPRCKLSWLLAISTLFAFIFLTVTTGCGGHSSPISVAVTASAATVDGTDTITLTAAVTNDRDAAGVSWSVSGGGALSNTTSTSATYTAPAPTASAQTITITATSMADDSKVGTVTITVAAKPSITNKPNDPALNGAVGGNYSYTLSVSGGVPPYTWTVDPLPPCLSLNGSTGIITGTITAACAGTFTPTFTVTDSGSPTKLTATEQLTIVIAPAPPITLPASVTSPAIAGQSYSGTVAASGGVGALTYSLSSGSLPAGLTLNTTSGAITGTPTTAGAATFTVQAADAFGDTPGAQSYTITVNPGAATHFAVAATSSTTITAGGTVNFSVTALDANGNTATGYSGTVKFTSTDSQAALPANATLTSGVGSFVATLKTAGTQTITATDTATASITGSTGSITVNAGAASKLSVSAPTTATAGTAISVTVTAQDQYGNTAAGYTGTVQLTSTDTAAVLPAGSSLSSGTKTFPVTLKTAGTETVTATDTVTGSITGTSGNIAVSAAAAAKFIVTAPATASAGTAINVSVTAQDAYGNTATGYTGTVKLTSTDAAAVLPASAPLASGVGTFPVTLKTAGAQTVTATDTVTASITGSSGNIQVSAAGTSAFTVSAPATATAGTAINFTVTAKDAYGNPTPGYSGTVKFTSSDSAAVLPASSTLTNGAGSFAVTFKTSGSETVTATDTQSASITGASGSISVSAAAATTLNISAPATATAGTSVTVSVTAKDTYGNIATGYSGTIKFTSTDGTAVLPANSTLNSGASTFPVTFKNAGSQTVTATDTSNSALTATTGTIQVSAGAATMLSVTASPSATAGIATNVSVTARDAYGNVATGYSGTVHFTSSDSSAVLPGNSTLAIGVGAFQVTFKTAGAQTVTATDTVTPSITGASGTIAVSAGAAATFVVSAPGSATAGSSFNITVTAKDAYGNVAPNYSGTVKFTSSDSAAALPANSLVNGSGNFPVTLKTSGNQTVTATDTTTSSITGASGIIAVSAASASTLSVQVTSSTPVAAGGTISFTVTALDPYNNVATGFAQQIQFTSTLGTIVLPGTSNLTSGTGAFAATPKTATSGTITATDISNPSINGTSQTITVTAGPATQLAIAPFSFTATAGTPTNFNVSAQDQYGNAVSTDSDTIKFTSSDQQAALPANTALSGGVLGGLPITFKTAGNQTITATDATNSSVTGTSAPITVSPGTPDHLLISAPASVTNGVQFSFTVKAQDAYNNTAIVNDSILFSSTDPQAVFVPLTGILSNGTGTFNATLKTNGNQTISGADQAHAGVTGTSGSINVSTALIINTNSLPPGIVGTSYSQPLSASGGSGTGYTWSVTVGASQLTAVGLSLSSGGTLSGATPIAGTATFTAQVQDSANHTTSQSLTVTIEPKLTITTTTLPNGTVGVNYSQPLAASGGSGTGYTWSVTAGATGSNSLQTVSLGLSSGGVLAGASPTAGTANFTVQVTDSQNHTATQPFTVNVYASLSILTTSLQAADVGQNNYSQTLQAQGGDAPYTWSTTGSNNLSAYDLSVSSTGVVSGNIPSSASSGTVSFTAKVTDSAGTSVTQPLTIQVYPAMSLPGNTTLVPGYTGIPYSTSIDASGGSGTYVWTVSGLPADGLNKPANNFGAEYVGTSYPVLGTPTSPSSGGNPIVVTFNVTIADIETGATTSQQYTINLSYPTPVTLPASSPDPFPAATVGQSYSATITAIGGVPPFTWTINGQSPSNYAMSNGLTAGSNGNTLTVQSNQVTGSAGSVTLNNVEVADSNSSSSTQSYTITVNPAGQTVSGNISLMGFCGNRNNFTMPTFTVSINTNPVQQTTTDTNGNYSFAVVPNGTYTITPSITGPSSLFYPAALTTVVVDNNTVSNQNFQAELGYTVSGTVSYTGSETGQIYVELNNSSCGPSNGTSISAPGAFSIHGVLPGNYSLSAWMDPLGFGSPNASDPTGSGANLAVENGNLSNQAITLTNPAAITLSSAPSLSTASGFVEGVALNYKPNTTTINNNEVESATSYNVQWSIDSSFTSPAGSTSFPATGTNGAETWILNAANVSGLALGDKYYFRAQGVNATSTSSWSSPVGPVTIAAPTAANTVTGQVTWTGTATGPLYVGFFSQSLNQVWMTQVGSKTTPPTSPSNFSVQVPSGTDYYFFGLIDQSNSGVFAPGDPTNTNGDNGPPVVNISGNTTENLTLPSTGSLVIVPVSYSQNTNIDGSVSSSYNLTLRVYSANLNPVAATLESGPNIINPVDIPKCADCGGGEISYNPSFPSGATPKVGDTYSFLVTYSNKTTATMTAPITGWNGGSTLVGASDAATLISPAGTDVGKTPNFNWTYPADSTGVYYNFSINDSNYNSIWGIPPQNSNTNGFTSSQITPPLLWGVDPTDSSNTPSPSALSTGSLYSWNIYAQDNYGNSASSSVTFTTTPSGPLSLPAANPSSLPSATVGQYYSGTITATGGIQPYQYGVNNSCYGCNMVSLGNGSVAVTNGYGATLQITGTPATANPITFQLYVRDAAGTLVGPITYTITVQSSGALSLPSPNPSSLPSATVGSPYSGTITATGGYPPYQYLVGSSSCYGCNPVTLADNLSVTDAHDSTMVVQGTPTSADLSGVSFPVTVKDSSGATYGPVTYTIVVNAVSPIQISFYGIAQGMVNMPYTFNSLDISGGVPGYTVTYSNLPPWLSQQSGTWNLVGTPTSSGSTTITVNVTDSASNHQSTTFTVNVVPLTVAAHNSYLKGQYACYEMKSWDGGVVESTGKTLYRGGVVFAFAADGNGNITGGEADSNGPGGYKSASQTGNLTGTYAVGSDNRGYLTFGGPPVIAIAGGNLNSSGQFTELALEEMSDAGASPKGSYGGGHCYQQNTTGLAGITLSGAFVSAQRGEDGNGNLTSTAGIINFNGSGTSTSGTFDTVDAGVWDGGAAGPETSGANSYTTTDSFGRLVTTALNSPFNQQVWYITNTSPGRMVRMTANPHNASSNNGFSIGESRAFISADVGASYPISGPFVIYASGVDDGNSQLNLYKSMILQGAGSTSAANATFNLDIENVGGTVSVQTALGSGSYTVDPNTGRFVLPQPAKSGADVFYFYDTSSAVALFGDGQSSSNVQNLIGWVEPQTAPASGTWSAGNLAASYFMGTLPNGDYNKDFQSTTGTIDSSGNFTYFAQDDGGQSWADWDENISGIVGEPATGALVPDTTLDPNGTYGVVDFVATPQVGSAMIGSYCLAISVDKATNSATKGRSVCIDSSSSSPQLTIVQE